MKKYLFSLLLFVALTGCTSSSNESTDSGSEDTLSLVTTFYPVYEFTQQVAGDRAEVHQLIAGGTDAHHFEPSARDVAHVNEADLFVYSSEEMESWVPSLLDSLDNKDLGVVRLADKVDLLETGDDHEHDHDHEEEDHNHSIDPHIWLDPILAQEQINTIKEALIAIDPEGESVYTENAKQYNEELQSIHEEYVEVFESATARIFFTQHNSFGYIADRYNLTQIAVGGLSTEVEPSPARIAEINQLIDEHKVPVMYYQDGANSSIAQTIAQETGTEVAVLYDLESLSQEMKEEELDYLGAMRENLEALKQSIQ